MARRRQADSRGRPRSMRVTRRDYWQAGMDNRSALGRLENGYVRDLLNLDPQQGGSLSLRAGYEQLLAGNNIRGMLTLGEHLLLADGSDLVEYNLQTASSNVLRSIVDAGVFVGAVLNNELFFSTAAESFRYTPRAGVREWGVPRPSTPSVSRGGGSLLPGTYRVYVTYEDEQGEGPASRPVEETFDGPDKPVPYWKSPPGVGSLSVSVDPPSGYTAHVYCTARDGAIAFRQAERTSAGTVTISPVTDSAPALDTAGLDRPPLGTAMTALNGVLLIAADNRVYRTEPFKPHLYNPLNGFFQFDKPITVLQAVAGGVFVVTDEIWFLTGVEGAEPQQQWLGDMQAVPGSQTLLPDGSAFWMGQDGPVFGAPDGSIDMPARKKFSPELAQEGTAGIVEHNGNQTVVTSMRGLEKRPAALAAGDFFEAEVIEP